MTIIKTLISLILSLAIMTGGNFTTYTPPAWEPPERTGLRFEEVEYRRPDPEALRDAADTVTELVASGANAAEAAASLDDFFRLYDSFYSMSNIARIRSFADVGDAYYASEYARCLEFSAEAEMQLERVYLACGKSEQAKSFEKEYFGDGFLDRYGRDAPERYNAAVLELSRREAELVNAYYELTASPTLLLNGGEFPLTDCLAAVREEEQYDILLEYYRQYNQRIAELYISLVKVRTELAREMGYGSVWELYAEQYGRDFDRAAVNAYLDGIAKTVAPLYRNRVLSEAAEIPAVEEETLFTLLETAARSMGGKTQEAFNYLQDHAMGDFAARPEKAAESFTVYLTDLNTPFAFVSAVGNATDIFTVFHEFGHFTQMYADYNAERSLDLSECFSQGMELLALANCAAALDEESFRTLRELKVEDLFSVYLRQGLFARFEDAVYSLDPDTLTPAALNSLSLACAGEFGMTDYFSEEYCSYFWMDVTHFILYPYYVLSYCVSADAALQMYALEREREGAGTAALEALIESEEHSFLPALKKAGLQDPFSRISALADELRRFA